MPWRLLGAGVVRGGEDVGVSCSPDEDELGGEGADAREGAQFGEGLVGGQGAQAGRVEVSGEGRFGQRVQALDLEVGQPWHVGDGAQGGGGGEGMQGLACDVHARSVPTSDVGLDAGCLGHADAVADEGPDGGFVGRVEADRAQPRVVRQESGHHRVRGKSGECGAVGVEGEDAGELGRYGRAAACPAVKACARGGVPG